MTINIVFSKVNINGNNHFLVFRFFCLGRLIMNAFPSSYSVSPGYSWDEEKLNTFNSSISGHFYIVSMNSRSSAGKQSP